MEMIANILKNALTSLYQYFGGAILISIFFMYAYMYFKEHGLKDTYKVWIEKFKKDSHFRGIFFFIFYTMMIILRTVLCRNMWISPLSNVKGVWTFHDAQGNLNTEGLENIILFIPFISLYMWAFSNRIFKDGKVKFFVTIKKAVCLSFLLSLGIEMCQLFLRIGTFQLSDLTFNTLGGLIGGIIFFVWNDIKEIRSRKQQMKK